MNRNTHPRWGEWPTNSRASPMRRATVSMTQHCPQRWWGGRSPPGEHKRNKRERADATDTRYTVKWSERDATRSSNCSVHKFLHPNLCNSSSMHGSIELEPPEIIKCTINSSVKFYFSWPSAFLFRCLTWTRRKQFYQSEEVVKLVK